MNRAIYLITILLAAVMSDGCKKKPCSQTYTISGEIVNGTNGAKFYNVVLTFIASDADFNKGKQGKQFKDLGTARTDSSGKFSFTYNCSDFPGNQVAIVSDLMSLGYIPYNQSYHRTWYRSSLGTLILTLKTSVPMVSSDTLFLWHRDIITNKSVIDTLRNLPSSYNITFRTIPGNIGFYYGRGSKEFIYNYQKDGVKYAKGSGDSNILGDPAIDSLALYY